MAYRHDAVRYFNSFNRSWGYSLSKPPPPPEAPLLRQEDLTYSGDSISGTVINDKGLPMMGAIITIANVEGGTIADADGHFTLAVPEGAFTILFQYVGYADKAIVFDDEALFGKPLTVVIEPGSELLDEIVVTAYKVPLIEVDQTTSGQTLTSEQIRNLPTRNINQLAGIAAGVSVSDEGGAISIRGSRANAVAYYVDGIRVGTPGAANSIKIRGISGMVSDSPLYIVDGKIVANVNNLTDEQITSIEVLRDAASIATYGAQATNGVVIITTTSTPNGSLSSYLPPVDLRETFSDYAAFVPEIRTDAAGRAVFDVTFPDDITAWNTFAVGQDRKRRIGFALERTQAFLPFQAQLYLPRFLVEGDASEAATLAVNREGGERKVRLTFSGGKEGARTQDAMLGTSSEVRFPIIASSGNDSLTYQFSVQTFEGEPASDGEKRSLPVYPKGTEMVGGELLLLTKETTALPDEFVRPERGPVTLRLPGNRVQQMLNDLHHIVYYPYACTEQSASRLIGLLQLKAVRTAQGEVFLHDEDIPKMIARLEKLRKPDGGFGWWAASEFSTPWISLHAYRALAAAERAGHTVANLTGVRRYLLGQIPGLPVRDQLQVLLTLAEEGNPPTEAEIVRIDTFSQPNDYELLAITRLRQLRGDTVDVQRLLDSSSCHAAYGRYWGRRGYFFYRQPLDGRLACGLLAHKILTTADSSAAANETINYLLGQTAARNRRGNVPLLGTNTLESARLLAELLPSLLAEDDALAPLAVTLTANGTDTRVTKFPYETEISPAAIPGLRLERSGSGPLPVSIYQRWFETQPTAKDDGFRLSSQLIDARDRPLTELTRGATAFLEVSVDVSADADYVLIEVPIPAGCSYADRAERRGPYAVHREYRRDRVAIFCDRLPTGRHTYKIALATRFSGTYTLNPARAEMQYLPVVNGNGELKTVRVE